MRKILSVVLVVALLVTIMVPNISQTQISSPLTDNQALSVEGADWLGGCGMAGMWGVGAILLSAGPAGWFALGIGASLLLACVTL